MPQTPKFLLELIEQGELRPDVVMNGNLNLLDAHVEKEVLRDVLASRPTAGHKGRLFISTDNGQLYYDDGSTWLQVTVGSSGALSDHGHTAGGDGGTLARPRVTTGVNLNVQGSTPSTPASGQTTMFVGSDGNVKQVTSAGVVTDLAAGGGGGLTDHDHTAGGDGGPLSGPLIDTYAEFAERSAGQVPGTPVAGRGRLYLKDDNHPYVKDDTGAERRLDITAAADLAFTPSGNIAANNVQSAIAELDTEKSGTAHTHTAAQTSNTPSGNIAATTVQAALNELDAEKSDIAHGHLASGISFTPAGNVAASNVQAAVQELDGEKVAVTGGVLNNPTVNDYVDITIAPTPGNPGSGKLRLYSLSDGETYTRDSLGNVKSLSATGGGAPSDHNHTGAGDGGALTNSVVDGYLEMFEITSPGAPGTAGRGRLYGKPDGHIYWYPNGGSEQDLTSAGGTVWTRNAGTGLIYPVTLTDRVKIGDSGDTNHLFHVVKSGSTGTIAAPQAPVFIDQTITAIDAGGGPDVGQINTLVQYLGTAPTVSDVVDTGIDSRGIYGAPGTPAQGTVHRYTLTQRVVNSASYANEFAGHMGWVRIEGNPGTQGSIWMADWNVHGPVGTQPGALMGVTQFINNYYNGSPSRCISHGFAAVTAPGTGAGAEPWPGSGTGHANYTTYPVDAAYVATGRSQGGANNVGFRTGFRAGGNATPWFPSGTPALERGLWISDVTNEAILITGTNTDIQWGVDGDPGGASIGWPGSRFIQVNERLRVKSSQSLNDPLIDAGNNITQSNSINLWNLNGTLSLFVVGSAGNYLPGTAIGDVGVRASGGRFWMGKDGVTNPYFVIDSGRFGIGLGTSVPNNACALEVRSAGNNSAVLLCPLTSGQFDAIASKPTGLLFFNSSTNQYEYWDGTQRRSLGGGSGSTPTDHNHTASAGDGGRLTGAEFDLYEDHQGQSSVATNPSAGWVRHFSKTDSRMWQRDTTGLESPATVAPARDHLTASVSWNPPSMLRGAVETVDVTVSGAQVGDIAHCGFSVPLPAGMFFGQAAVTAVNTVTCTLLNFSNQTQDLALGTLRVAVWRY